MMNLEILFVGIGSIAQRHIKNFREVCLAKNIDVSIDALRRPGFNKNEIKSLGIRTVYTSYSSLKKEYDVVFITNPTELHMDALLQVEKFGKHFFIEKPIAPINQLNVLESLVRKKESIYYVACPLRYNSVIQYIKDKVNLGDVVSVRSISSSYLPDWRPGVDYRSTYSAQKNLGGGVSIDLIHEWDYLTYLFGKPRKVCYMYGKKSNLEIDSDDCAEYIAEYENKFISLHLDYFGRKTIREIMLLTNEETIIGDIANNKISFLHTGESISFYESRDDFQKRELEYFLGIIGGININNNDIDQAIDTLKLTQGWL